MTLDERTARMALCALQPMGDLKLGMLVAEVGAPAVWEAVKARGDDSRWGRKARILDPESLALATHACGARFIIPGDEEWPAGLADLGVARSTGEGGPPLGLWVRGVTRLSELEGAVSIVGARSATAYGTNVTTDWSAELSAAGRMVVSGLAFGIDAAAHRGALMARRPTVALLACGVDISYPVAHTSLMQSVVEKGAVVSEVPPGTTPIKASFLARNRLIAALSEGLVVVEAAARSGAKNSAAWANELGRVVMAVPGPVTSSLSATPNRLIRDGAATLVTSPAEIIALLSPFSPQEELPLRGEDTSLDALSPDLRQLREAVVPREEVGAAELSARTGLSIAACLAGVDELVELGWLEERSPQRWALPSRRLRAVP